MRYTSFLRTKGQYATSLGTEGTQTRLPTHHRRLGREHCIGKVYSHAGAGSAPDQPNVEPCNRGLANVPARKMYGCVSAGMQLDVPDAARPDSAETHRTGLRSRLWHTKTTDRARRHGRDAMGCKRETRL